MESSEITEITATGALRTVPGLGFGLGIAFGGLILLVGLPKTLLVLGCGMLGALGGLAVRSAASLELQPRAALEALMDRAPRR